MAILWGFFWQLCDIGYLIDANYYATITDSNNILRNCVFQYAGTDSGTNFYWRWYIIGAVLNIIYFQGIFCLNNGALLMELNMATMSDNNWEYHLYLLV